MFAHIVYNTVTHEITTNSKYADIDFAIDAYASFTKSHKYAHDTIKYNAFDYEIIWNIANIVVDLDIFSHNSPSRSKIIDPSIISLLINVQKEYFRTKSIKQIMR